MNGPNEKFWVEIDLGALRCNIRAVQSYIGPKRDILFVVKSDAYGHGALEVVRAALAEGVESFGVATVAEALALREAKISETIILLQPPLPYEFGDVLAAGLQPSISDFATAQRLSALALGLPVHVHLELNTGMNRMGFDPATAIEEILRIAALPDINIAGIFTHFRPVDSNPADFDKPIRQYNSVLAEIAARGLPVPQRHAASSFSVLHCPEAFFDCIRPGLLLYGGFNGRLSAAGLQTKTVMSCHCRVLFTRRVKAGEWLHYGNTYQALQDMKVAIIAAGYGAGYPKSLSNVGEVLIDGRRAPICGVVGMDMTIVDVSAIGEVGTGDLVTLLGADGDDQITAVELAEKSNTIPYEILCRLGRNLPRIYAYPEIHPRHEKENVGITTA